MHGLWDASLFECVFLQPLASERIIGHYDRRKLPEVSSNHHGSQSTSGGVKRHRQRQHGCFVDDDHIELPLHLPFEVGFINGCRQYSTSINHTLPDLFNLASVIPPLAAPIL